MTIRIYQVDAFTDHLYRGNPAAVCFPHESADPDWMQAVAAEMNLAETAFLWRRADGSYDLRFVTDHDASDNCGVEILGDEPQSFWKDHKGAKINAIRNRTLIEQADVVVVRFGEKYRQWNAAFDAGYAAAMGKPIITLHSAEHTHGLKEVDAAR